MYEAFSVVSSAAILGMLVGIIAASTMTAQLCLFAEVPFELYVSKNLWIICFVSLVTLRADNAGYHCCFVYDFCRCMDPSVPSEWIHDSQDLIRLLNLMNQALRNHERLDYK